ncbi:MULTISPECIES: TetR/AcrR family transcriptional regulator [Asaia]|nr:MULTISPECIES: TetR/AcrR family transcriptional regulator [Asaia]GBR00992.1 TetR family transcriptional regulator [Asaia lannensis NBRC 102526]
MGMTSTILPSTSGKRPRRYGGRPPATQAGEVDRRILNAATSLFLDRGFDATSCDQVAALAGAGKASIYARYANKEELFAAVIRDNVDRGLAPATDVPWHLPLEARLMVAGQSILSHSLRPEVIALMRVVMSTAHRMPELARLADRIGREGGMLRVAAAIIGQQDVLPDTLARALPLAAKLIDLVFAPHQMRALMGEDVAALETAAPDRIREAIHLLAGAGWLQDWQ